MTRVVGFTRGAVESFDSERLLVVSFSPACFRTIDVAFQPGRPSTLRHRTETGLTPSHGLGALRKPAHRFARAPVFTSASVKPTSRGPSPRTLGFSRSRPLFRAHRLARQRSTICFELAFPPVVCLAARDGDKARCVRPTSASHNPGPRAPAPRALPASLRSLRFALDPRACTRGRETGETGVSRRQIRFGGPSEVGEAACSTVTPPRAEPLASLSLPILQSPGPSPEGIFRFGCQGRSLRLSVKIGRSLRPEMPSVPRSPAPLRRSVPVSISGHVRASAWTRHTAFVHQTLSASTFEPTEVTPD